MEGHPVHGFEVEMEKIDTDLAGMQARVWVDKETKRIVRMEWMQMDIVQTMDHFVWNEPTEDWFTVSVPAGYTDQRTESVVSESSNLEETTQCIIMSLRTFSKYSNGNYTKVKYLYGDATSAQLAKLNGSDKVIQRVFKPEDKMDDEAIWLWMESKPEYKEYLKAIEGFASINVLQGQNADAAYYGKTVSSKDKNRILLRWQLETGEYQVIFGDLSYRTVAKEQLKALETK